MNANQKLLALLNASQIEFKTITHAPTLTSIESAQVRGATLASGAKAMICSINDEQIVMCVLAADRKISYPLLKAYFKVKNLTLLDVKKLEELTGCLVGAVPPFGSLFGIKTILDPSLIEQGEEINFNAGLRTESVNMLVKDYLHVEDPEIVNFSVA